MMIRVLIEFEFHRAVNWPQLEIPGQYSVDEHLIDTDTKTARYSFESSSTVIQIANVNKTELDTVVVDGKIVRDQFVTLRNFWVDEIMLDLDLVKEHCRFVPKYSVGYLDFCKVNDIVPPPSTQDFTWYFNGEFEFKYDLPFWDWYDQIARQQVSKHFSSNEIEMYFGTATTDHVDLVRELKNLLEKS